jgi:hypothetical protein
VTTRYGNYSRIDPKKPRALGMCDLSGFLCRHEDLIRQMEYRGNGLVWTGFLVHPDFADQPNPQGLVPILLPDPIPIKNPRPDMPDPT